MGYRARSTWENSRKPPQPLVGGWEEWKIRLTILFITKLSLIAVLLPQGKVIMIFRLYPDL